MTVGANYPISLAWFNQKEKELSKKLQTCQKLENFASSYRTLIDDPDLITRWRHLYFKQRITQQSLKI